MVGINRILLLILSSYLAIGTGFAILTPHWQNPDEPAHYNYIRQLAETGTLPILQMEDYDQLYLEKIIQRGFPPELDINPLRYESHQPPLYYLLALPVYQRSQGQVLPLRFFSLILGACLIVVAYGIGCTIAPNQHTIAYSTAAIVALLPQHTAIMASVNNDALAELLMVLVLWLALRERLRQSTGRLERTLLGLAVGLAFLTKMTVAIAYPVAAFALLRRLQEDRRQPFQQERTRHPELIPWVDLLLVLVLPLLLALPWWLRNLSVYGWPDFLGLIRHASAAASQPQTGEWIAVNGFFNWLSRMFIFTFQSFWGQFGWMAVPMRPIVYQIIVFFCGILIVSWLYDLVQAKTKRNPHVNREATALLLFSTALTLLAYVGYNYSFVQHQGRYLYSAIVPICLALSLSWMRCFDRLGFRNATFSFSSLYILLVCLNLYALFGVIQPHAW